MHEGGMISPCIIQWPAGIKPQAGFNNEIGHVMDLLPTAMQLAGAPAKTLPGKSLSNIWTTSKPTPRTIYWEHEGNKAMRQGNLKLVRDLEDPSWQLYDLSKDPTESHDLAQSNPKKVNELLADFRLWSQKVGVKEVKKGEIKSE